MRQRFASKITTGLVTLSIILIGALVYAVPRDYQPDSFETSPAALPSESGLDFDKSSAAIGDTIFSLCATNVFQF
ncbi:MAG: hypothetical protein V3T31_06410, partial [candidate division Zixibacteria bacterium]